jgi:hypothetical protein
MRMDAIIRVCIRSAAARARRPPGRKVDRVCHVVTSRTLPVKHGVAAPSSNLASARFLACRRRVARQAPRPGPLPVHQCSYRPQPGPHPMRVTNPWPMAYEPHALAAEHLHE